MASLLDQFKAKWIDSVSEAMTPEQYAAKKKMMAAQPHLFDSHAGQEKLGVGRWITIGSEKDEDGGHHGGHHVFIGSDGEMKTGKFAGQTMAQAFGGQAKQGASQGASQANAGEAMKPQAPIAEGKKMHWYGMNNRPLQIGAQPKGFVDHQPKHEAFRHGAIAYDRPLSDDEQKQFELTPIRGHEEIDDVAKKVIDGLGEYASEYANDDELLNDRLGQSDMRAIIGHVPDRQKLIDSIKQQAGAQKPQLQPGQQLIEGAQKAFEQAASPQTLPPNAIPSSDPSRPPTFGQVLSKPAEQKPQSGIQQPPTAPGDQLGLFGDTFKAPAKKPVFEPTLAIGGKQQGLFDTSGNASQMQLFGDAATPGDLVYKPEAKEPEQPKQEPAYDPRAELKANNDKIEQLANKSNELFQAELIWQKESRRLFDEKLDTKGDQDKWKDLNRKEAAARKKLEKVRAEAKPLNDEISKLKDENEKHIKAIRDQDKQSQPKPFEPVLDQKKSNEVEDKPKAENLDPIPFRERKAVAAQLASDGKQHSDIVDHFAKRGVALVDARKLAADALGDMADKKSMESKATEAAKPEPAPEPKSEPQPEVKSVEPPKEAVTPTAKATNVHDAILQNGGTPREAAKAAQKQLDEDYQFARASTVRNAGEDLKGSARHRVNEWKSLEDAEKNGTAEAMVQRDSLLRHEPHDLMSHAHKNPATSLAMHFAMRAFPAKPGTANESKAASDREEYLNTYRNIKKKAEELAQKHEDPEKAIKELQLHVRSLIDTKRTGDRYNATANDLVGMHNALKTGYFAPKTGPAARTQEFLDSVKAKYGEDWDKNETIADSVISHAHDIMEGKSMNATFGKESKAQKRFDPSEAYVKHATRKGGRDVADVTSDPNKATKHMVENFGIRGVQWGNTVSDDERKHHAAKAVESLVDLADVVGLHPKDIALDGKLGLAFGARGKGTASAHYEPSTQVINLTRASGVGTLAHEWGHAFDHMLTDFGISRKDMDSNRASGNYMSNEHQYTHELVGPGGKKWNSRGNETNLHEGWKHEEKPKRGIREAYGKWKKASGDYRKRLKSALRDAVRNGQVSQAKADDYWNSDHEIFARTFERHVQHKLHEDGRENTYLSGLGGNHPFWPTKEEAAQMAPAFDAIFEEYRKHKHGSPEKVKFSREAESVWLLQQIERYANNYSDDWLSIDRYEWNEQAHPREAAGQSIGGQFRSAGGGGMGAPMASSQPASSQPAARMPQGAFQPTLMGSEQQTAPKSSKKRELAERPDMQQHHSLHWKNQSPEMQIALGDYRRQLRALGVTAARKTDMMGEPITDENIWKNTDKAQLQKIIDDINAKNQASIAAGGTRLDDLMNYNDVIPKTIAERLEGGRRFFDPEALRGKWFEEEPKQEEPQFNPEQSSNEQADAPNASRSDESQNEPEYDEWGQSGITEDNTPAPITADDFKKAFKARPPAGVSKAKMKQLEKAIRSQIRDDDEVVKAFVPLVVEAFRQVKAEVDQHNFALRQITGATARNHDERGVTADKKGSKTIQSLAALTRRARAGELQPDEKKHFDEWVHDMENQFPHILGGKGEMGLVDMIATGIKPQVDILDQEVAERAITLAGPDFFGSMDNSQPEFDAPSFEDDWQPEPDYEQTPFSWMGIGALIEIKRYEAKAERERYAMLSDKNKEELPYGYCPKCGAPGVAMERSKNGNTICKNGHSFPHAEFTTKQQYAMLSEAQIEAGNYKKKHVSLHGLKISIETKKGERRRPEWPPMPCDYGDIKGTEGNDGDPVDVFVGPNLDSEFVCIVDQVNEDATFDEHKCLFGFDNEADAVACYKKAYTPGWKVGPVTCMTVNQFKAWLKDGNQRKQVHKQVSKYAGQFEPVLLTKYTWNEEDHPRGQPENKGEFVSKDEAYRIGREARNKSASGWISKQQRKSLLEAGRIDVAKHTPDFIRGWDDAHAEIVNREQGELKTKLRPYYDKIDLNDHIDADDMESMSEEELDEKRWGIAQQQYESDEEDRQQELQEHAEQDSISEREQESERNRKDKEWVGQSLENSASRWASYANFTNDSGDIRHALELQQKSDLHNKLQQSGWQFEYMSESGSLYYKQGERSLRVSNHEVPETAERQHAKEQGSFSWFGSHSQIIVPVDDLDEALEQFR